MRVTSSGAQITQRSKGSLRYFGQSDCYGDQRLIDMSDTNSSCDKSQSSSLDSLDAALASVSESKINYHISCQYEQTLAYWT